MRHLSLKITLLVTMSCALLLGCQRSEPQTPQPDLAFKALKPKEQVLLKRLMVSYDRLYEALDKKRLADMQLHAGGLAEAAKSVQFALDLESSGAVAMANLSAQQIAYSTSTEVASQQFEDLTGGVKELLSRFPSLRGERVLSSCTDQSGAELTWLRPLPVQGGAHKAPYLHKSCTNEH